MGFFKEELLNVKGFVFDVDGVLSRDVSPLDENGDPARTANVKDGYAIRVARRLGYPVAIITGGGSERVKKRHLKLGVEHYYDNAKDKIFCFRDFLSKTGLEGKDILFMGDDIVDYQLMHHAGLPTCPKDAVPDIKALSKYISPFKGGEGCVRDVIEQTLKAHDKWKDVLKIVSKAY